MIDCKIGILYKQIYTILSILFLLSCNQHSKQNKDNLQVDNTKEDILGSNDNFNFNTNIYSEIDSSGILIFPLSIEELENNAQKKYIKPVVHLGNINFDVVNMLFESKFI